MCLSAEHIGGHNNGTGGRTCLRVGMLLATLPFSHASHALRADYTAGVQAIYTDNIALVENNPQDEVALSVLGGLLLEHEATDLDANIRGLVDHRNYLEDTYGNETLGSLNANVEWRPLPGALHLVGEDYFTQTVINSAAPETPDNRVNANAFSVGPDIFLRMAPGTTLESQLRRSEYYFENSTADSSRNSIMASLVRAIRPQITGSANIAFEDAQYQDQSQNDFSKTDYFLSALFQRGRSHMTVDAGISDIDRNTGEDVNGFLGRLSLGRQIRMNARLDLDVATQYTDSGMDLLTTGAGPFEFDRAGEQVSGDIFFDRRAEARYTSGTPDRNWTAYIIARDEDYERTLLDRRTKAIRFDVHRVIADATYINAHALYREEKFLDLGQTNKSSELGLGLERQLTRKVTARLDYAFNTRSSNVIGAEYDENRVMLLVYFGSNPELFR